MAKNPDIHFSHPLMTKVHWRKPIHVSTPSVETLEKGEDESRLFPTFVADAKTQND